MDKCTIRHLLRYGGIKGDINVVDWRWLAVRGEVFSSLNQFNIIYCGVQGFQLEEQKFFKITVSFQGNQ